MSLLQIVNCYLQMFVCYAGNAQIWHLHTTEAKFIELTAEKFTVSYMNFNLPSRKVQCLVGTMQNQFLTNSRLCVVSYK
jgi:hypothetical protein